MNDTDALIAASTITFALLVFAVEIACQIVREWRNQPF